MPCGGEIGPAARRGPASATGLATQKGSARLQVLYVRTYVCKHVRRAVREVSHRWVVVLGGSDATRARGGRRMFGALSAPLLLHALVPSPTRTLPQHSVPHITRTQSRRSPLHRRHQPVRLALGEDDDEDISEGWRPEVELARYRLEGRAQSDSLSESEDLSNPDTWAAQAGLLKERTKRVGAAEKKGKRNQRKDAIDAVGGLAFGAAFLGASWAVKEELLSAEAALGGIAARSKCPFGRTPSRLLRLLRGSRATGRPALPQVIELAAHSHRL